MSDGINSFNLPAIGAGDQGACFMAKAEPEDVKKKPIFGGEGVHLTPAQQNQSIFC